VLFFFICFNYGITAETTFGKECKPSVTTSSGTGTLDRIFTTSPGNYYCSGQVIFEDNFDTLNLEKWQHENTLAGGGNWEFQWYTNNRSNSFVKDGKLHIRPTLTSDIYGEKFLTSGFLQLGGGSPADSCTNDLWYGCARQGTEKHVINPVRSARIRTIESFNFKYGTLEVRAKLPAGDWLWPAIWLLPKRNAYGGWPASGEVDLLESRGNLDFITENGENIGVEQFGSTLHYGPDPNYNGWPEAHFTTNSPVGEGFNKDFHVYKLTWTPENFTFYLDGKQIGVIEGNDGFFEKGKFPKELDNPWISANNKKNGSIRSRVLYCNQFSCWRNQWLFSRFCKKS